MLGGCSPQPEPVGSSSPSVTPRVSPSPLPSPSSSPTVIEFLSFPDPPEGEEPEIAEIRAAWQRYQELIDRYYRDPEFNDLDAPHDLVSGEELNALTKEVLDLRSEGLKITGSIVFRDVQVSDPVDSGNETQLATVTYCEDSTASQLVLAASGEVVYQPSSTVRGEVTMELMPDGLWRVVLYRSEESMC